MDYSIEKIRNIAIIAHVDHGKTTLVDGLLQQSGSFRKNQEIIERVMDSMDQEKERGITIRSKTCSIEYNDHRINIVDTPGHADFGGQVEAILRMVDGALLIVDAAEGPMPQTQFVVKKAIENNIPFLLVINKIDKESSRPEWVIDQVFDLLIKLDAPDELSDFNVIYASAKNGYALSNINDETINLKPLFEAILKSLPAPSKEHQKSDFAMSISAVTADDFLGRLAIGKIQRGSIKVGDEVCLTDGERKQFFRIPKLYHYNGNKLEVTESLQCGEIGAIAGTENAILGDTIRNAQSDFFFEKQHIDPPTLCLSFIPNDSPFSGREGRFLTSTQIQERLDKACISDLALSVSTLEDQPGYRVSGRGELHLSTLIETMRRESYELQISSPEVVTKIIDGQKMEPYEQLILKFPSTALGDVMGLLGDKKAQMVSMNNEEEESILTYTIPTRSLLGLRSPFLTITKGLGIMNTIFDSYQPYAGDIIKRSQGVLISMITGKTSAYALKSLEARGVLFVGAGEDIYEGQIIGLHSKSGDLTINPIKGKKLTNVRASGSDDAVNLTPHKQMSLEQCLTFINEDELVEVTPDQIRMRKRYLKEVERKRQRPIG